MNDKISLKGLEFFGYHGLYPEERKLGQKFIVDIDLYGDFTYAAREDDIKNAVDYSAVFMLAKKIIEGKPHQLLESLTLKLCKVILSKFKQISQVTVRVQKPEVFLPGVVKFAAVEMTRKQSGYREE